ncbi:Hsp33 family molecular chaperone HslO [Treponema sp.]
MILRDLQDTELSTRLQTLEADGITRFSLLGNKIRGFLLSGIALSNQARTNHQLGILESLALSQAYMSALLLSSTMNEGDRCAIRMDCTGALRGFSVEGSWEGGVRGYLFNDTIHLDAPLDSFDLKPFIGTGTLSVIRMRSGKEPFKGIIQLVHGRIAEDLAEYFLRSEQTRTAIGTSVRFDTEGRIAGAGALMLQALPGASDVDLEDAELRIREMPSLGTWFAEGHTRKELLQSWFAAFDPLTYSESKAGFYCDCSRERFAQFLGALAGNELQSMIDESPHPAELICHNCASRYEFTKEELEVLRGSKGVRQ